MPEPTTTLSGSILATKSVVFGSILAFFSYLSISGEAFVILVVLMCIDFITGIAKSYAVGTDITSHNAWYGIIKKILTLCALLSISLLLRLGDIEAAEISLTLFMGLFATAEVFSTIQNIVIYHTRKPMNEFNATKFALEKLLEILKTMVEKNK